MWFVAKLIDILSFICKFMYALILFYCIDICRWISSKEINKKDIRYWKREIPRLICQMQQYLPPAFFNSQEQNLIHQVEEIELCGLVHTRSMWMVERHLIWHLDSINKFEGDFLLGKGKMSTVKGNY